MTEETAVVVLNADTTQVAGYKKFYTELVQLEKDNAAVIFDYASKKGEKEARSHIFSLRKSKGALERVRKEAKDESLRIGHAIDSEAKSIEARIEAMIEVHQKPLDEMAAREKERVDALNVRMAAFPGAVCNTVDEVKAEIERVTAIEVGPDWQEFMAEATQEKLHTLEGLSLRLAELTKRDEEAAELARLRAEADARAQADREAAIAKAAADKAQREAEEKAAAEQAKVQAALDAAKAEAARKEAAAIKAADDAKAEAARKEQAAALAIQQEREKAQQEKEAAARREAELKLAAEMAEKRRQQEAAEAERQRVAAIQRAEEEKQRAIKAEQARVAAENKRIADEAAARERNKAHKASINRAALESLVAGGMSEECAKQCVTLIAQGKVANVSIAY